MFISGAFPWSAGIQPPCANDLLCYPTGAPEKETKLKRAVQNLRETDSNAKDFPTLYGFHGSEVKNWHVRDRSGSLEDKATKPEILDAVYLATGLALQQGHKRELLDLFTEHT